MGKCHGYIEIVFDLVLILNCSNICLSQFRQQLIVRVYVEDLCAYFGLKYSYAVFLVATELSFL